MPAGSEPGLAQCWLVLTCAWPLGPEPGLTRSWLALTCTWPAGPEPCLALSWLVLSCTWPWPGLVLARTFLCLAGWGCGVTLFGEDLPTKPLP